MKIVVQRSKQSSVIVNGQIVGKIDKGIVLLICFEKSDEEEVIKRSAQKVAALRIFQDPETGKMSKSLKEIGGSILCISQFTLSWDGKKGNRPSFDKSMEPDKAKKYFESFCQVLKKDFQVETGVFGAEMELCIQNDGPVTFTLSF